MKVKKNLLYSWINQQRGNEVLSSATPKDLKTTEVDDHRIISSVKKKTFIISSQVKNTPEEKGVLLSKSTMKRNLH